MLINSVNDLPPQATTIYRLLLKSKPMNAATIGKSLGIYPHAVYRSIKPLVQLGLVNESHTYPVIYQAKPSEDALNGYLNNARESFMQSFFQFDSSVESSSTKAAGEGLPMTFVKDRQDMLTQSNEDMKIAKKEVVMIVSGLVASAETILAYKRAADRGVRIRIIVQRLDEANTEMLRNWKKLGVEVRYYPLIEARILIFDSKTVYFTSYNPNVKEEGIGVRFNYAPMALLANELFEKRWKLAKEIS